MRIHTARKIHTRYGVFSVDSVQDEKMARGLESSVYPNEGILSVARAFVNEKSIVVDIGAHIGTFAIPIAKVAEKVIVFEPSQEASILLSLNAKENDASIQIINKALGSEKGSGTLVVRNASNAGAHTLAAGGDIPVVTLDDEVTHADFIKIDVEGMELDVLHGGSKLIDHSRPVVLFEVNLSQLRAHGTSPRVVERFFISRGYRLYTQTERKNGALARVRSATLFTALRAPRAWLFFSESAPFDLLAIPEERSLPLPHVGFMSAVTYAISNNIAIRNKRIAASFRRIF